MSGAPNLARRAAAAGVALATALLGLKVWAAAASGSVAMLGSAADSALDLLASLGSLAGVTIAARRADEDHRFGHGKAESLAALFQVLLIAVSAAAILWRAIGALAAGARTAAPEAGIAVSIFAAAATAALVLYQRRVVRATGSVAIRADRVHYASDLALNGAVAAALALDAWAGVRGADAWFAIAIALWLACGAAGTGRRAIDDLMDREWPEAKRRAFLNAAAAIPEAAGLHDLRTRSSGAIDFAQFHLPFPPELTILEVHRVMEDIEDRLGTAFPRLELLIHPDPDGHVDRERLLPAAIAERSEI